MTAKEKAKEILIKARAFFNGEVTPPPPPAPPPPPTPTAKTYKLQDGVTEITINQAGETPAAGDTVMIGGAPAPANTYTLQDGATIVVDATGAITTYTAMAAPPPSPPAPPAPPQPVTLSAEEFAAMVAKFATGSTEERIANLEVMTKALMDCNFGYEIRKGQEAAAIEAYKESLATMQNTIDSTKGEMQSAFAKVDQQAIVIAKQEETINKHQQTIKDLFELCEQLVEMPNADPVTLTGRQKEKFEKMTAREERLQKMAEALKTKKTLA